ncbi:MAG TPA: alpha-L-fucosidase [Terracidiphilus sp.]|nr:alpha-L-fucosidase [Terracidiphilus sp.]
MPFNNRRLITRRDLLRTTGALANAAAVRSLLPGKLFAQNGAPAGAPDAYARPKPDLPGPVLPSWQSVREFYHVPKWFHDAKIGIFIHWGLYSIPAHKSEWYSKWMYTTDVDWHTQHYGPPDKFGYKDFIPLFQPTKFDADEWIGLFQRAGARYMCPVAEHHDGFAMWDSDITPWCAGKMGPKRDLIGELEKAARKQNMIWGCSTHRMEHHTFMYPAPGVPNDQFDPRYAGFYGPPVQDVDMNGPNASPAFQGDWLARIQELADKYHPEILYLDNGVNPREYDPIKLRAAAYLFNRAHEAGYESTMCTKQWAYLYGTIQTAESMGGSPQWIYPGAWQCDTSIGNSWGYITGLRVLDGAALVRQLITISSCGGNYMLNVAPMADGTIPEDQQKSLLAMGEWLRRNGEAVYGARTWLRPGEGPGVPEEAPQEWRGWPTGMGLPGNIHSHYPPQPTTADFRFTVNKGNLYATGLMAQENSNAGFEARLVTFKKGNANIRRVTLLDGARPVQFSQTEEALICSVPALDAVTADLPYTLKLEGAMSSFGA